MFHDYSESQIDKMERTAMDWLVHHDERLDVPVRFDAVSVAVLGEQRAMLRHHVNCVNKGF